MRNFILLLFCLLSINVFSASFTGKVVKVKDGDTFSILINQNEEVTVRLAGVDCPEKAQDFGYAAKQFSSDFCYGKEVSVEVVSKDVYGRTIGWLTCNGKDLSRELLRNGLAWWYEKYSKDLSLKRIQNLAKKKKIGLWSKTDAISPEEFRKSKKKV